MMCATGAIPGSDRAAYSSNRLKKIGAKTLTFVIKREADQQLVRFALLSQGDIRPPSPGDLPRQEIVVAALAVQRRSRAPRVAR